MGLGAIEAIEAAGVVPGKDIKIVSIDAVKDGMQALADGKINFIVECNPLLGRPAADLVKKVLAGEERREARSSPRRPPSPRSRPRRSLPDRAVLTAADPRRPRGPSRAPSGAAAPHQPGRQ